jgi:hypothetical protein
LVKSPPELWAEVSEVEGLERHLGEFGEITITRAEPETKVAWEGENASGTVELEPTGWGTKVTITADVAEAEADPDSGDESRPHGGQPLAVGPDPLEPEPVAFEPKPDTGEPEPVAGEPEPVAGEPELVAVEPGPVPVEPDPGRLEPEPDPFEPEPVPAPRRRGFFARWFSRGHRDSAPAPAHPVRSLRAFPVDPEPQLPTWSRGELAPQPEPEAELEPVVEPVPTDDDDEFEFDFAIRRGDESPEAEEAPREALAPEHAKAVLEAALENLGQAHHRPFSRG